jgi:hypothetical protein
MVTAEDIDKAVAAHGEWKSRLGAAIESGTSEFCVPVVRMDTQCAFGRWFYSLPSPIRATNHASEVQRLHADFHLAAAEVLALALTGRSGEATDAMGPGSRYATVSGGLLDALNRWKRDITSP